MVFVRKHKAIYQSRRVPEALVIPGRAQYELLDEKHDGGLIVPGSLQATIKKMQD
jgi:hypothetical protein